MCAAILQQTDEWHKLRRNKIGASDSPIIMGVNPWSTPYQLWQEKLSLVPPKQKSARMERGLNLENEARLLFTAETGIMVNPEVLLSKQYDWMMASFDGVSEDKKNAVEIKCPGKEDHGMALSGKVPEKYMPQLQHQMYVLEVDKIYYLSYDPATEFALLTVERDDNYIKTMLNEEQKFWECLQDVTPPKMTQRDYTERKDEMWLELASQWLSTSSQLKELEKVEKEQKDMLISMAQDKNSIGGGVKLTKVVRKGSVDYTSIPELKDVDVEKYRKGFVEFWKISQI